MPAIAIRLGADLVRKVKALKAEGDSIGGYVQELIEKEYRERGNRASALVFEGFLRQNPDESRAMNDWESAPLAAGKGAGKQRTPPGRWD
jgi:hypothetical protein